MKISRSYLLGLGSGLILSALLAMIMPPVTINFGSKPPPQQGANQGEQLDNQGEQGGVVGEEGDTQGEAEKGTQGEDTSQGESESTTGKTDMIENEDGDTDKETFVIPRGSTATQIANLLLNEGWISSKEEFIEIVGEKNLASRFRAGTFQLSKDMSIEEILSELIK